MTEPNNTGMTRRGAMGAIAAFAMLAQSRMASAAEGEGLKIAVIEALSGPQASSGMLFLSGIEYGTRKINQAGGFNGKDVEIVSYDNAGTSTGASSRFQQAVADGCHLIVMGSSSAIVSQLSEDARKHALRNPETPMILINVGSGALAMTGERCHFHNFRMFPIASMSVAALTKVMGDEGTLGKKVFTINQDYSWGQEFQAAVEGRAAQGDFKLVGSVLHDVNRIQDFSPYVAQIKASGADTVLTGNWSNDLLLLIKACADASLGVRFGTCFLDQPGNIGNAGVSALGHYVSTLSNCELNPEFAEDFRSEMGHYPVYNETGATVGMGFLAAALASMEPGETVDVEAIGLAMEQTEVEGDNGLQSMRAEDHQFVTPLVVSRVDREAKYPADDTDMGFLPVARVSAEELIYPVQDSCQMPRPT